MHIPRAREGEKATKNPRFQVDEQGTSVLLTFILSAPPPPMSERMSNLVVDWWCCALGLVIQQQRELVRQQQQTINWLPKKNGKCNALECEWWCSRPQATISTVVLIYMAPVVLWFQRHHQHMSKQTNKPHAFDLIIVPWFPFPLMDWFSPTRTSTLARDRTCTWSPHRTSSCASTRMEWFSTRWGEFVPGSTRVTNWQMHFDWLPIMLEPASIDWLLHRFITKWKQTNPSIKFGPRFSISSGRACIIERGG